MTCPKGHHRRPPAFFHSAIWGKAFGIHRLRRSYASSVPFGSLLGRSWRVLSPIDRLLGSLEAFLGPPGALLGASWSLLGGSWALLGASWTLLEPTWRRPKQHTHEEDISIAKKGPTSLARADFWGALGKPKSTQIGAKTRPNLRRFSRPKKLVFKSLLEPSWADLGAFGRPSWGDR